MITLSNGQQIPQLGVGTWTLQGPVAVQNVCQALQAGFRHIDTAQMYGNEAEVGQGICLSGVPRADVFLTTKVNTTIMRQGPDAVRRSIEESLERLQVQYLDLLLIHWPVRDCIRHTWQVMEQFVTRGKVRSLGVSNFNPHHLDDLLSYAQVRPVINQIEIHPFLSQVSNIAYNRSLGIQVMGWAPFGQGDIDVTGHPLLRQIADRHGKTAAQVVLRWLIQRDLITIPRAKPSHFQENLDVMNFTLTPQDMQLIDSLNQDLRSSPDNDPETFPW